MKKRLLVCKTHWAISFIALFLFSLQISAQHIVSGKITDDEGLDLFGASVLVKGTSTGTVSEVDGTYRLEALSGDNILIFSYTGFETQEIEINGRSEINVTLLSASELLDEIVVVGYGRQKKKLVTGATVNVSGDELQNRNNTNALQALQGQTAGVNITSSSGQPGSGFEVNIRGVGTIGNSNPLYIVDGFPTGDITYLNNADIESVDILKDAASAAIYGSRAANGVILITTKKGKEGKPSVTFDSYRGTQSITNKLELLNSREYATIMNEQAVNSGKLPIFSNAEISAMDDGTNWVDQILVDNALTQNYSLGFQGGSTKSVYAVSANYTQQEGIIGGKDFSNYDRYGFRINSEHKILDRYLTIGENLAYTYINQVGVPDGGQYYNHIRGALNTLPFMPVYDDKGEFYNNASGEYIDQGTHANPYANLVYNNQKKGDSQQLIGNVYLESEPIKNITFRSSMAVTNGTGNSRSYTPAYELSIYSRVDTSSVSQSFYKNFSWNWENTLNYANQFGKNQIDVLVGSSAQKWNGSSVSATNANLIFDDIRYAYIDNTTYAFGIRQDVGGSGYEDALLSYFGRVLYNYDEKYLFSATMRADGSAKFAEGNRWGYFPSVSAGWVITNEDFFADTAGPLTFLKLRASWGQNGSNFVAGFQYLAPITLSNTNYTFGTSEGSLTPGAYPSRLSNEDIHWETSEQMDIGFDSEFFGGKLFLNADWYSKITKDWLIQAPILATAGADAPFINGGDVINTGVELVAGWKERSNKFKYSISGNVAYNKNEVRDIPTDDQTIHGETNELWNNAPEFYRASVGLPIGYFWGYETDGIFQNEAEINSYTGVENARIQPGALPGDLKIVDTNGDGVITSDDKVMIGDPNPDFVFGLAVTLEYGSFDFSVAANGVAGNQLVQSYRNVSDQFSNYPQTILDRWHGEGSSNTLPRLTNDGKNYSEFSDIYVFDGDFIRINNISLGYDFSSLLRFVDLEQFRVFLSAQNAFTFTKYTGMDPEIGYGQTFARGVDVGYYPRPRVLLVGLNMKF